MKRNGGRIVGDNYIIIIKITVERRENEKNSSFRSFFSFETIDKFKKKCYNKRV